eukprot:CAMPEP_0115065218 /NCGR_PEP_ID=MMETSP0227-20121206/10128_1 /TAXON_ID=89957 /ORGANISM="Polarella glacialis, Strain CCMP 1383" /LENGTH=69 /DNA_ID=CAMNT_0002450981 /DNA_START=369 /DNA_END=575 /DNA_ORIENTATION=-
MVITTLPSFSAWSLRNACSNSLSTKRSGSWKPLQRKREQRNLGKNSSTAANLKMDPPPPPPPDEQAKPP